MLVAGNAVDLEINRLGTSRGRLRRSIGAIQLWLRTTNGGQQREAACGKPNFQKSFRGGGP
jgi:hypothetical protein